MVHKVFSGLTNVQADQTSESIEILPTNYDATPASKSVASNSGKIWVAYNITAGSGSLYLDVEWSPDGDVWMEQTLATPAQTGGGSQSERVLISDLTSAGGASTDGAVTVTSLTTHKLNSGDVITVTGATGDTNINGGKYFVKVLTSTTFEMYTNADLSAGQFVLTTTEADAYTANTGSFYNGRTSKLSGSVSSSIGAVDVQMDSDGIISQSSKPYRAYTFDATGKFVRLKCLAATGDTIAFDAWIGAV